MIGFITLLIIAFSIVMSIYSWKTNKNIIFLSLFLAILSLSIYLYNLLIYGGSLTQFAIIFLNTGPLYFLPGPFIYFFIRGNINDTQGLKKKDLLHFIPFVIDLFIWLPYILSPWEHKLETAKMCMQNVNFYLSTDILTPYPHQIHNFIRGLHVAVYMLYSLILLILLYPDLKGLQSIAGKKHVATYRWLFAVMLIILTGTLFHSLIFIEYFTKNDLMFFDSAHINIVNWMAGVTIIIAIMFISFPGIMLGMPGLASVIVEERNQNNLSADKSKTIRENNNQNKINQYVQNNSGYFDELSGMIIKHMEKNKPFLDPKFKIYHLTTSLNVPQHHIQFCINNLLMTSFTDLKNKYRIEYARKLISEGYLENKTLESLSAETGFASISNFYAECKKLTGYTPLQLHKNQDISN